MPTTDLDAVRDVLPWWVTIGAYLATPLMGLLLGTFAIWLADIVNRPRLEGLHWTEVARRHYGGTRIIGAQILTHAALTGVVTYMLATGALTPFDAMYRALFAALMIWAVGRIVLFRRARRVLPWLTAREFINGQLFHWVVFLPILVVAGVMAIFGPPGFDGHEIAFVVIYGGGIAILLWLMRGRGVTVARWLGIVFEADERTQRIVAAAAERCGHTPDHVWIGRTPMANAIAVPTTNEVVFTSHALDNMTDEELTGIALHEIGHLTENRRDRTLRTLGIGYFIVCGMWRPIYGWVGLFGLIGLLALGFIAAIFAVRAARRLETDADSHAHEHGEDEGESYARSLERLHEINLAPAVMQGRALTHPHLYDRMLAAGVTPDYDRPAPPPKHVRQLVLFGLLALVLYIGEVVLIQHCSRGAYASESRALWGVTLSGGQNPPLGALGFHWQETDPQRAATVLAFLTETTRWPEYPARLARVLAKTDPDAARASLEEAAQRYAEWDHVDEWLRELVDDTRAELGMPKKDW